MNFFASSPESRVVTFNKNGSSKEIKGISTIAPSVDGTILLSTDAASKITEKAVSIAFDRWVVEMTGTLKSQEEGLEKDGLKGSAAISIPKQPSAKKAITAKDNSSSISNANDKANKTKVSKAVKN